MNLFRRKSVTDLQAEALSDHSLKRALGATNLTALGVGAIIGTGIFVLTGTVAAQNAGPAVVLSFVLAGVASVFARYTFVLHSSPRPTVFLTWLIIPGIVYAWRRGERLAAIQGLALLLAAIAIDTLGVRRGLKSEYFIFTDPLIILAGAVLLDTLSDLRFHRWTYPIAVVLFGLHIAVGQAEPIKYAFMRRGPEPVCEWNRHYMPLLPLPWCSAAPVRP